MIHAATTYDMRAQSTAPIAHNTAPIAPKAKQVHAVLDETTGVITVTVCKDSNVNESQGVGKNPARENLGVQCEDGNGYQLRAK